MYETEDSPSTGLGKNFKVQTAEEFPYKKWLISNLWEHFLVPEHWIPIWVGFELGLSMEFIIFR